MTDNTPKRGIFRKIGGAVAYSFFGSWSDRRERLTHLKELKNKSLEESQVVAKEMSEVEERLVESKLSQDDIEREKFEHLIALKSFSEEDVAAALKRFKHHTIFFSLGFSLSLLITFYVIYSHADLVQVATCLMAILYFTLKSAESWWRFTQIKDRRLMTFKRWLFE